MPKPLAQPQNVSGRLTVTSSWNRPRQSRGGSVAFIEADEGFEVARTFAAAADTINVDPRHVNHRREPRFKPNQTAVLKVLALRPGPVQVVTILDISGSGMRLRSRLPYPCGAHIELESEHLLSRGTICRCEVEQTGQDFYEIGVHLWLTGSAMRVRIRRSS
jgi:PilZ domain